MRVHGDHGIDHSTQKRPDDPLAHRFPGLKSDVLAHVCEVRRDQGERLNPERARGLGGKQQLNELFVGLVQAAQQHGARRQAAGSVHWQAQLDLSIREAVAFDRQGPQTGGSGQAPCAFGFVGKVKQAGSGFCGTGHVQFSSREGPGGTAPSIR